MNKVDNNKRMKRKKLLDTAFRLFTSKGIKDTSISDIARSAGVAKGTFYLYFKDKYDIRNKLIAHKAGEMFQKADNALKKTGITEPEEKVVFLADNIIDQFVQDRTLLGFIAKKLGWGVFKNMLTGSAGDDEDTYDIYHSVFDDDSRYEQPEIMVFMIIELVGATCYSSILYNEPVEIDMLRPYIFRTVRQIMAMHEIKAENG